MDKEELFKHLKMIEGSIERALRPISADRELIECDGFFISFNNDETAIVVGPEVFGKRKFYILNGNHLEQYRQLVDLGLEACMEYWRHSEKYHSFFSNSEDE